MNSRFMFAVRLPSLLLAAALQFLPLVRTALPATQSTANLMAIVFRWGAGIAAALGGVQAVSGASTVITTPLNQNATNGVAIGNSRIRLVAGPEQAGYWNAVGLPNGLFVTNTSASAFYIRGTPTVSGDFSVTITAKENATSGKDRTTTATMVIHVLPGAGGGNSPPVANAQSVSAAEDTVKPITLTGNDSNSNPLTYAIVGQPAHGTLSGTAPNVTYTAVNNYNGPDNFTFKVNDGTVDSPTATVSITVTAVNDAPVANAQDVTTAEDTARAITLAGSDVEGSPLTYSVVVQPSHGTLSGTAPNVTYSPAANYNGPDSFTFKVNDGTVDSPAATVSITITAVNDAPTANAQSVATDQNVARAITLTGADVEGSQLTYSIVVAPAQGTLAGTAPNVTYMPANDYSGSDSFTFKVNDGSVDSSAATVSIAIAGAVLPPTIGLGQPTIGPGGLNMTATGSPGMIWSVERATQPAGPWTNIGNLQIGPSGTGQFNDANPPTGSAFYRTIKN